MSIRAPLFHILPLRDTDIIEITRYTLLHGTHSHIIRPLRVAFSAREYYHSVNPEEKKKLDLICSVLTPVNVRVGFRDFHLTAEEFEAAVGPYRCDNVQRIRGWHEKEETDRGDGIP